MSNMKRISFSFSIQCTLKEVRDPSHKHVSQPAQIATSPDKKARQSLICLGQVRNNCCTMLFLLSSPYLEIIVYDDNSWVVLKLMRFWLLQLFEPMGLVKKNNIGLLKMMKTSRSAVKESCILQSLVGCSVVGSVCLEISDIAFDGINLVTALGAYTTYSK